jgi:hypothetical protein
LSAFVADPAEAMPIKVKRTQKTTTMRLWARTQRVTDAMRFPSFGFDCP